jgi:hypothetical protein
VVRCCVNDHRPKARRLAYLILSLVAMIAQAWQVYAGALAGS